MHETALMKDLMNKLNSLAQEHDVKQFKKIHVRLGALSHFTEPQFKQHFMAAVRGTPAQWARLVVETSHDIQDMHAREIVLVSVELDT